MSAAALSLTLTAIGRLCTQVTVHYPVPLGDQIGTYCDNVYAATFPNQPLVRLNTTSYGVNLPKATFKCGQTLTDDCELEYNLQPESGTAPNADTEG